MGEKNICTIQKRISNLHLMLYRIAIIHFYSNQPLLVVFNNLHILVGIWFHSSLHMVFRSGMFVGVLNWI